MRPRAGFVVKWSAARSIVTLFCAVSLDSQKRIDHARAGRLRLSELENGGAILVGDSAAVVIDQIDHGGLRHARDRQHSGGDQCRAGEVTFYHFIFSWICLLLICFAESVSTTFAVPAISHDSHICHN